MEWRDLVAYNVWATEISLRQAKPAGKEALRIAAHMIAAQRIWAARLAEKEPTVTVRPDWDAVEIDRQYEAAVAEWTALQPIPLDTKLCYTTSTGIACEDSVGDLLHHIHAHNAFHRGEIRRLAEQAGVSIEDTDVIVWRRSRTR